MKTTNSSTGTSSAYVRVSSKSQDDGMQRAAIERAAAARGNTIKKWFAEKMSAKTLDRPELSKLRAQARMGTVKTVFTFKLDRLCRSGVADTFAVVDELRRAGVTLIAVADNLTILPNKEDLTSEVLVFALGLAARLERTAVNDRIASARARIESEGGRWGRPSRVDTPTLERAKKMRLDGRGIRAIAAALKIPRSTIAGALAVSEKHALARPPENGRDRDHQQGVVG
jgi:DNA invertase Pin-like site-specific DNA recombinase